MTPDEQLDALLKQGRILEPAAGFDEAVWRRIRGAAPVAAREKGDSWWAFPLALAASVLIGIGLGTLFPEARDGHAPMVPIARHGSLTGAYIALATGGDHE